ncbi:MAG TPA: hypothetical protein VK172_00505 [Lentimicrobium sp.]|nr:hypothetical protein [Lentimicrobium sp.]
MKPFRVIESSYLAPLESDLFDENGLLRVMSYDYYKQVPKDVLRYFAHQYGIYVFPTTEMIDWFRENIEGTAIEIGAGHGALSRALGIPITDSRMQELPEIILYYQLMRQPVIKYPDDIEKLDAEDAITKYLPDNVIGGYIIERWRPNYEQGNHLGVNEHDVIKRAKKYILILNMHDHKDKWLFQSPHKAYKFPWIVTRSEHSANRICVWKGKKK